MNKDFERVFQRIESYKDEMVELQKKLVSTVALGPTNGGQGELDKANLLEPMIREIYESFEMVKARDERVKWGYRPNMIARTKGTSDERTIWIMSHLDVVSEGDRNAWQTPPFELVVKDGMMYGRGVEDNHIGIIGALFAAKALKKEGIRPKNNVAALFASDEETGNDYGARYLMANYKNLFGPKDLAIVPDWGDSDGSAIDVAEKSCLWLKLTVKGKQAHASTPKKGINAHQAGAYLVCKLDELYKKYDEKNDLYDPPISTFEPTLKEANIPNVNTVPDTDVFCIDCRVLPTLKLDDLIKTIAAYSKEIEEKFGVKISHETIFRVDAPAPTPADSPIVGLLQNAAKDIFGVSARPVGIGGGTFGSIFRQTGLHVAVYTKAVESAHQPNEHFPIKDMIDNTKILAHVLMQ